jgi:rRNA-processing protein FCF1
MRVAMDASALMMPVEAGVRVFEELDRLLGEYEGVVPAAVVAELEKLAADGGEAGRAASVGRDLAERCETVETEASYADDALVELAREGGIEAVVTNDQPLGARLREAGTQVIHLRGRNKLTITD